MKPNTTNTKMTNLENKKKSKKTWLEKPSSLNSTSPSMSVLILLKKIEMKLSEMFVDNMLLNSLLTLKLPLDVYLMKDSVVPVVNYTLD